MIFRRRAKPHSSKGFGEGFVQIGAQAQVKGRLEGHGLVLIHGGYQGELSISGEVIVGPTGRAVSVRGAVDGLHLEGELDGDLTVHGPALAGPGARLRGRLCARKLDASPSATVAASLRIDP
jgi:cytoskeletal protein CcmA (bactofilin family)